MKKKLYRGLCVLIGLFVTVCLCVLLLERSENRAYIQQLEKEFSEYKQMVQTGMNPPVGVNKYNTRPDEDIIRQNFENKPNDGNEYVWHGDHWCRVEEPEVVEPEVVDIDPSLEELLQGDNEFYSIFFRDVPDSDLPDELPAEFPTDEELRQMSYEDLRHLRNLYLIEFLKLRKTDYDASVKFYNSTLPRIWKIQDEKSAELRARRKAGTKFVEDLDLKIPDYIIFEEDSSQSEGGKE